MKPTTTKPTTITNDNGALPAELATAVTKADQVLERYGRLYRVLAETHASIPEALANERRLSAELGGVEVGGGNTTSLRQRLTDLAAARAADVRRRGSGAEAILGMEADLISTRKSVETAREVYAAQVVAAFQQRYSEAFAVLQALQVEAAVLSQSLRVQVPTPAPPTAVGTTPSIPPAAQRIGATLDRLDAAIALCGGIRASRVHDSRLVRLQENRDSGVGEVTGTFTVLREFTCQFDQLPFKPGDVIDSSLAGPGALRRLLVSRVIRLASGPTAVKAA